MELQQIKEMPTCFKRIDGNDCHESILQSYQLLNFVKDMLRRGDSAETILMIIKDVDDYNYSKAQKK